MPAPVRRILLFKLGAIGDVIMVVPAAYHLYQCGFQIDWVCGRSVAPLLQLYPWINVIPVDEQPILSGGKLTRLRALLGLWRTLLGRGRYTLCATLYYNRISPLLTLPVRADKRLALNHIDRASRLIPGRHASSEYLRLLMHATLGQPEDELPHKLAPVPLPANAISLPAGTLPPADSRPRVVLVPAGARNLLRSDILRRWPMDHYIALAETLIARGYQVVLTGGPGDTWAAHSFAHLPVIDLIGKLSLVQSTALLGACDLVISHDTGPLHMAGLTATPLIGIFGPTDPHIFFPARANAVALWGGEGFACRPCYDGRTFAPCTHNGCLHQVTVAMVLAEVENLLRAHFTQHPLPQRILVPAETSSSTAELVTLSV